MLKYLANHYTIIVPRIMTLGKAVSMEWPEVRMQWFGEQARTEEGSDMTYE